MDNMGFFAAHHAGEPKSSPRIMPPIRRNMNLDSWGNFIDQILRLIVDQQANANRNVLRSKLLAQFHNMTLGAPHHQTAGDQHYSQGVAHFYCFQSNLLIPDNLPTLAGDEKCTEGYLYGYR